MSGVVKRKDVTKDRPTPLLSAGVYVFMCVCVCVCVCVCLRARACVRV